MKKAILFDLDGTLTDSGEGIINCAQMTLERFGLNVPSREEMRVFVRVIKIGQDSEKIKKQELEEYVITDELKNDFTRFFDAYDKSIDAPTDKMGAWISGFFG